jgi:hypothetical protein
MFDKHLNACGKMGNLPSEFSILDFLDTTDVAAAISMQ